MPSGKQQKEDENGYQKRDQIIYRSGGLCKLIFLLQNVGESIENLWLLWYSALYQRVGCFAGTDIFRQTKKDWQTMVRKIQSVLPVLLSWEQRLKKRKYSLIADIAERVKKIRK